MIIYLGIDPGISGALARIVVGERLRGPGSVEVWPTPTITVKKGGRNYRVLDLGAMWRLLREAVGTADPADCFCALEAQHAFPEQGVVSGFNTGYGFGAWVMALWTLELPHQVVHPATWKKVMFLDAAYKKGKGASILAAKRLFPAVSLRLTEGARKDSDGAAEALLLAEYARRIGRPAEAARAVEGGFA